MQLRTCGDDLSYTAVMTDLNFSSLPLSPKQFDNLQSLGYRQMTPVQAESLPAMLAGRDLRVQAKTGSGKTVAFGLGLLNSVNPRFFAPQSLVLCPTRELAEQVGGEVRRLARAVANIKLVILCGGKPFRPQAASLEHGAHIVVGTPGRVLDHLQRGTLKLNKLNTLVLDEADRMLDMGFAEAVDEIIDQTPESRQTLLFSATYSDEVEDICFSLLTDPVIVELETQHDADVIEQRLFKVVDDERDDTLLVLFHHYRPASALVFCHTKKQCADVARWLRDQQVSALAIHGDLDQRERDLVLAQFANGSCCVLVATDVAARGLDIDALPLVINYELPTDPEVYQHRIGRTGRAGQVGAAVSLFSPRERRRVAVIESFIGVEIPQGSAADLKRDPSYSLQPAMVTLELDGGRRSKLRAGDILGALTGDAGLAGSAIGKIDIGDRSSLVAIETRVADQALRFLSAGKIKGRAIRARRLGGARSRPGRTRHTGRRNQAE